MNPTNYRHAYLKRIAKLLVPNLIYFVAKIPVKNEKIPNHILLFRQNIANKPLYLKIAELPKTLTPGIFTRKKVQKIIQNKVKH